MSRRQPKRRANDAPSLRERLFQPVDIASLVAARIAFGAIMVYEVWVFLDLDRLLQYTEARYLFTYPGFHWVELWPGDGLYFHFYAMGVFAFMVMVGFLYRFAAVGFFLTFLYFFLLDQTNYLNHFYLVCLLAFLLIFMPVHRSVSVDAWLRPKLRSDTAPAWALWILRAQLGIVYFFGGVAKLNGDWLRGYPMRIWMPGTFENVPVLGDLFSQAWFAIFLSYGGLVLDLAVAPALLWKKTRPYAFAAVTGFHLANSQIFSIGIFPWLAIALTTLFFEPDWPRRLLRRLGLAMGWADRQLAPAHHPAHRLTVALLAGYLAIQVCLPLRHFLYPGNPSWTEEGHLFAWHMKLRGKVSKFGIFLHDPDTGEHWEVESEEFLLPRQYGKMSANPRMLHQFAHHVVKLAREEGHRRVEVRIAAVASLNGRAPAPLIDRTVDLAAEPYRWFTPARWILPLAVDHGEDWLPDPPGSVAAGPR
jgi:vitamin K-dependent gamma-carboxylase